MWSYSLRTETRPGPPTARATPESPARAPKLGLASALAWLTFTCPCAQIGTSLGVALPSSPREGALNRWCGARGIGRVVSLRCGGSRDPPVVDAGGISRVGISRVASQGWYLKGGISRGASQGGHLNQPSATCRATTHMAATTSPHKHARESGTRWRVCCREQAFASNPIRESQLAGGMAWLHAARRTIWQGCSGRAGAWGPDSAKVAASAASS